MNDSGLASNICTDKHLKLRSPQELLADLAANEVALVSFYLEAAETAAEHNDEEARLAYLKQAFVIYCRARVRLPQLAEADRERVSAQLPELHGRIDVAYFEEP